jgi:hypothetical protein
MPPTTDGLEPGCAFRRSRSTRDVSAPGRELSGWPAGRLKQANPKPIEPELLISIGLLKDPLQACSWHLWLRGGIVVVAAGGFEYETRNRVTLWLKAEDPVPTSLRDPAYHPGDSCQVGFTAPGKENQPVQIGTFTSIQWINSFGAPISVIRQ